MAYFGELGHAAGRLSAWLDLRHEQGRDVAPHVKEAVRIIDEGKYTEMLGKLKGLSKDELKEAYTKREMEPAMAEESWTPSNREGLVA